MRPRPAAQRCRRCRCSSARSQRASGSAMPARTMPRAAHGAADQGAAACWRPTASSASCAPVLEQLERDSGLRCYRELAAAAARASGWRRRSRARRSATTSTPEHERVYPIDRRDPRARAVSASFVLDRDAAVRPRVARVAAVARAAVAAVAGAARGRADRRRRAQGLRCAARTTARAEIYEAVLARIGEPDRAGLDDDAPRAHPARAALRARPGRGVDGHRPRPSSARSCSRPTASTASTPGACGSSLHLNQGNAERRASACAAPSCCSCRRAASSATSARAPRFELLAHALAGDLLGVKRALDARRPSSREHYPGWRPMLLLGQCRYRWLQGDLRGALERVDDRRSR